MDRTPSLPASLPSHLQQTRMAPMTARRIAPAAFVIPSLITLVVVARTIGAPAPAPLPAPVLAAGKTIEPGQPAAPVGILADDRTEGRATGTRRYDTAAECGARQMKS